MRESYLAADFRRTVRKRFPGQAEGLNAAFDVRLRTLWAESAGESRAKRRHLKSQILPGIAAYETLRTVLPQEEALRTVHGYLEAYAGRAHRLIVMLPHGNLMCWRQFEDLIPLLERDYDVHAVSFDGFDGTGTTTYTTAQAQAEKLADYLCAGGWTCSSPSPSAAGRRCR